MSAEVTVVTSLEHSNYRLPGKLEVLQSSASNPLLHLARGQGGEGGDSHGREQSEPQSFLPEAQRCTRC